MTPSEQISQQVRVLADRIADSHLSAITALYDLTAHRLIRYATTITRNQHDAEDAVQASLLRVADQIDLLSESDHPWSYLLRMVRNEALMILRRKKRWSIVGNLADLVTHRQVDQLEQEDTHRTVWSALRQLPTKQSEVVVLKIWEEMTFQQIGDVLGISSSTAASRYRYAIEKLTLKLQQDATVEVPHEFS